MGRERQRHRLAELERRVAADPARQRERLWRAAREAELDLWDRLLALMPREYHQRVADTIRVTDWGLKSDSPGLQWVFGRAHAGQWRPVPLPGPALEVFLTDPKAEPWWKCRECTALLPTRPGYWVEEGTGRWWQAPLRYFDACPGCGGKIVHWYDGRDVDSCSWLPARPDGRYRFQDESPNGPIP